MKIITKTMMKKVPKLMTQSEGKIEDLMLYVKLFAPWINWTWYIAEADFSTGECFGLVEGFERELGYFNLNELTEIKGPFNLKIERDRCFESKKYMDLIKR